MKSRRIDRVSSDILVIGGGAAAAATAMEAAKFGLSVTLVDKGRLGRSGSTPESGGALNAWMPAEFCQQPCPEDSQDIFFSDVVKGGDYLNNQKLTRIFIEESTQIFMELAQSGIPADKDGQGKYPMRKNLGYSYPRAAMSSLHGGGFVLMTFLRKEVLHRGCRTFENVMVTRLFKREGEIAGALGLDTSTGDYIVFQAKAVVVAGGSATRLLRYNSCNFQTSGDSYGLTYNVGAELMNMEFPEFTVIPTPVIKGRRVIIHCGGSIPSINSGARFFNRLGERYMERYDPTRLELTTRGVMVLANFLERKAGRGPVYMDMSFIPEEKYALIENHIPIVPIKGAGVDPRQSRVEWSPALHTFLGGARIDEDCQTTVPGLYAAGEAAGHGGTFGADRIGTAISACLVFGRRAEKAAARFAMKTNSKGILGKEIRHELGRVESYQKKSGLSPGQTQERIMDQSWKTLNVLREGAGLEGALAEFIRIQKDEIPQLKATNPNQLVAALEAENLALTAEMMARAALARQETRGQHNREDYPVSNNQQWLSWIILRKGPSNMELSTTPIPIDRYDIRPAPDYPLKDIRKHLN